MGMSFTLPRPAPPEPDGRTIPFDYVVRFELAGRSDGGRPGRTHSRTVAVSIEGAFTAVAIGYGVVPDANLVEFGPPECAFDRPNADEGPRLRNLFFRGVLESLAAALGEGAVGPRAAAALANGIRLNPRLAATALIADGEADMDTSLLPRLFQVVPLPAGEVQFLYTIRDEGSGREFQSEPILNTAGLGTADGDRPFRQLAYPMRFEPRTTIRMDVTELSSFKGLLHVSLHGYKTLGASLARPAAPAPPVLPRRGRRAR